MSRRILIVTSEPASLEELAETLESKGYRTAMSSPVTDELLLELAAFLPNLIIADARMDENCSELVRQLRSSPSTQFAPLILLLEQAEELDRITAYRYGADAVLTKPLELDQVLGLVASLKNGRDPFAFTPAERRVAFAVARGLTNKKIADELGISVRTVENHISNILSKKGFANRVEIARYVLKARL